MKKNRLLIIVLLFCYTGVMAQTSNPKQYKYVFTVAKDGTGDYNTIQDAIDAMRVYPLAPITLYIKNGTYREKSNCPPLIRMSVSLEKIWTVRSLYTTTTPARESTLRLPPTQRKFPATVSGLPISVL